MNFKIKTLSALAAVTAMSLASCSSEEPLGNNNQTQEYEGIGYMSFTIANPADGTKADDEAVDVPAAGGEIFNNGDKNEYAICPNNASNVAFYFQADGSFWGMSTLQAFNNTGDGHTSHDSYAEKYYTYVTRWRNDNSADPKPASVIVVLNADPEALNALATDGLTVSKLLENEAVFTSTGVYKYGVYNYGGTDYFTMSNSSFVDAEGKNLTATEIGDASICESAEEALKHPVTVYVERLLAKFELGLGKDKFDISKGDFVFYPFGANKPEKTMATINYVESYTGEESDLDYPNYTQRQWAAYIVSWSINGLEKKAGMLKNIANGSDTNYFDSWTAPGFHRSFWGESDTYAKEEGFTTQYRYAGYDREAAKYADKFFGNTTYDPRDETRQLNTLHYISFNNLQTRATYKYTGERTYSPREGRVGYGPYRFASHYLIGAQLLISGEDYTATTEGGTLKDEAKEGNMLKNVGDKYYAYNFYWKNVNDYIRYAYRRMATQFADGRQHTMQLDGRSIVLTGASTGTFYKDASGNPIEVKEAADYFTTQSAQVIHGDGKVTLKPGRDIYYKNAANEYVKLTDDQITAIIYNYAEAARHFDQGAMYYAIPVQHLKGHSNGTPVTIDKDKTEPWAIGQFGVVRNHWYRLTVNAIGSVGIPVDNPDQPIIPDPEDDYYIAIEIVTLPWHVINNGSVEL